MFNRNKFRCLFFVAAFALAANASAEVNAEDACSSVKWPNSQLGYILPMPVQSIPNASRGQVINDLQLASVGAVKTERRPWRATTFYVGKKDGLYLFAIAGHVLERGPKAVEFGHTDTLGKYSLPVQPVPVHYSQRGDMGLIAATVSDIPEAVRARVDKLKPFAMASKSVKQLMRENPRATFYNAGRANYPSMTDMIDNDSIGMWTTVGNSSFGNPRDIWKSEATVTEANNNKDERLPADGEPTGDVFYVCSLNVVGRGFSFELKDPDGLKLNVKGGGDPFLQSTVNWQPESIAHNCVSMGRSSGSPVIMKTRQGLQVVALGWTNGLPEDLNPILQTVQKNPRRAFGNVVVEPTDADPNKFELVLRDFTAPFSYSSVTSRALSDFNSLFH